jgi:nitroimidazol reductase NimA-like FMN-containing flavoprotein (pyridoxamine 5'-phosphate oxidase superfamily)
MHKHDPQKRYRQFIDTHNVGVISTVDVNNQPSGSIVYYCFDEDNFYFSTKKDSKKLRNIHLNNLVAFTLGSDKDTYTVQIQGVAEEIYDIQEKAICLKKIKERANRDQLNWPALLEFKKLDLTIVRIVPKSISMFDGKKYFDSETTIAQDGYTKIL